MIKKTFQVTMIFFIVYFGFTSLFGATDTQLRQFLEQHYFSEEIIKFSLYAKSSKDVYCYQKRKFVHGLPRVTLPFIYEPDVLTWQLAMQEHNKMLAVDSNRNINTPIPTISAPIPILPEAPLPNSPSQITLTPLSDGTLTSKSYISYDSANETINKIIDRAKKKNLNRQNKLKGQKLKEELIKIHKYNENTEK